MKPQIKSFTCTVCGQVTDSVVANNTLLPILRLLRVPVQVPPAAVVLPGRGVGWG